MAARPADIRSRRTGRRAGKPRERCRSFPRSRRCGGAWPPRWSAPGSAASPCAGPNLRFPFPERFAARLEGRTVTGLARRAKYLTAGLDSGETLIMHLGMSGRFDVALPDGSNLSPGDFYLEGAQGTPKHDHVVMAMSTGATVTYNDARRFGFMDLVPSAGLATCRHFARMGIEPLDGLTGAVDRPAVPPQDHAAEGRPAGPAPHRGPRQHLRLRGPAPGAPAPGSPGREPREGRRTSDAEGQRPRQGDRRGSGGGRGGRRLDAARLRPHGRQRGRVPARLPGLRPGRRCPAAGRAAAGRSPASSRRTARPSSARPAKPRAEGDEPCVAAPQDGIFATNPARVSVSTCAPGCGQPIPARDAYRVARAQTGSRCSSAAPSCPRPSASRRTRRTSPPCRSGSRRARPARRSSPPPRRRRRRSPSASAAASSASSAAR